jgi:glutamate-1-semialdehyde aminotransferase
MTVDDANNGAHFTDADSITYTDFCLGDTGAI